MDLFSVITLIGGLSFFLYGMNVLSSGLERLAGGRLEALLKKMTSNPLKSLLLGAGITAAIQSSSAVTVMLVGLVNSQIMSIGQCIGVIMGSNIGTTMTAWILTLVGVESSNPIIKLLKPENFSLIFAFIGILMLMMSKKQKKKDIGTILIGFAVLMYGMKLMSSAVKPLAEIPAFTNLLLAFENPLLGVFVGLLVTAVIQSSSASVGILQALALTGAVTYGAAIPIIMGQNIGTCVTALISSIGVHRNARKVAVVHIAFNLIGTAICLLLYCLFKAFCDPMIIAQPIDAVGIAVIHTSFNVLTTFMLFPFTKQLESLANRILPEQPSSEPTKRTLLDERLLETPSVAIAECENLSQRMAAAAREAVSLSFELFNDYDEATAEHICACEDQLDEYEDALGSFLVKLSSKRLSTDDSRTVSKILHTISDFERMGDHAVSLMHSAKELDDKELRFSAAAGNEIHVLASATKEILRLSERAYIADDLKTALRVEPLEQTIDNVVSEIKKNHIGRLQRGECSIELGFILADVMSDLERISDHCSNIAAAALELSRGKLDVHEYLGSYRTENEAFKGLYDKYKDQYRLSSLGGAN